MELFNDYFDPKEVLQVLIFYAPKIVAALLVLLVFFLLYRITRRPLSALLRGTGLHIRLVELLVESIYHHALAAIAILMAAAQLGINVAAALAGLGVAGVALGFAAQDSLANVISGIIIFWDKPFIVNDWVTVENQYGKVTDITLRSTRIRTPQNTYIVIPNKKIIDTVLVNHSKHGEMRVDVPVGIAYKEDISKARKVLLIAIEQIPGVRHTPSPDVVVTELGNSSVNLLIRAWIDSAEDEQRTFFEITEKAKTTLDRAGIQIPFPHLQLFWDHIGDPVVEKLSGLSSRAMP